MPSFGDRLRHEREARNATIGEISAATGIHRGFLEALERNEFQALPGRAFGKLYLRAYAEILDFDPQPLLVHYDRERHPDPPEPADRSLEATTLRKVEASLAKWRASLHGGREIVGEVEAADVAATGVAPEQPPNERGEPPPDAEPTSAAADFPAPVVEPAPSVPIPDPPNPLPINKFGQRWPRRTNILAATVGVGACGVLVAFLLRPSTPSNPVVPPPAQVTEVEALAPAPPPAQARIPPVTAAKPPARASRPATATVAPAPLTIAEFGVGRRDEAGRTVPTAEPFTEGEVVAFSTRVQGGRPGQWIRHVWLHEGRAVQSIRLRVGASDWRTHSTKTLRGAGPWSVEARDESGRVLAQAAFDCVRRPR